MAHDRPDVAQRAQPGTQRIADDRMLAHDQRFLRIERAALEQHVIGNRDLADVVEEAAAAERFQVAGRQAERAAKSGRVARQTLAMALRRRIARFDGRAESEHHRFGRLELIGVALQPHQRSDPCAELHRIERLAEEVVGAGFDASKALAPIGLRRDDDDRDQPRAVVILEDPADFEALTLRQQVQHDEIRRVAGAQHRAPVAGCSHTARGARPWRADREADRRSA